MIRRVADYICQNQMFKQGDRVIAAVSGGADSVCLLHILTMLRTELGIEIRAVHVHHGLRGAEADRDAEYTKKYCEKLSVPAEVFYRDAALFAKEHGISQEEAGRILRYEVFQQAAASFGADRIAVAHHADDNAETILHHLYRGSGLKGLGGIMPVRGSVVRPLLCVGRREILEYLEQNKIQYCEDSTNIGNDYTRNRIRNEVIPLIVSEVNDKAVDHILHAGRLIAEADAYLEKTAEAFLESYGMLKADGMGIPTPVLLSQEPVIMTYIVKGMINKLKGSQRDISSCHISQALALADKQVGKRTDLPGGLTARKTYGELWIERAKEIGSGEECGINKLPQPEYTVFCCEKAMKIPKNQYTKWFDYDKIKGTLSVRTRRTGDYLCLPSGGRKTVKSYMVDQKIPVGKRDEIILLTEGSHVIWIVGYRISEYYKVTESTKKILQVHFDGGKDDVR